MTSNGIPHLERISDYLFHYAELHPDREFLVSSTARLTYGQAAARVEALGRCLIDRGVQPGDRVATLANASPEFVVTFLATTDIGATWVGLNPKYKLRELQHVIDNCGPRIVFGITGYRDHDITDTLRMIDGAESVEEVVSIDRHIPGMETIDDLIDAGHPAGDDRRQAARSNATSMDPALLVYTSGTTGAPKGAVLTHRSLCWSFRRQAERWGFEPMRLLCNLPINHSGCVGDNLSTCLIAGGTLILMEEFDPDGMLELIPEESVNTLMQVPTQYQVLVGRPGFDQADLGSLRQISWGGAAMPRPVLERLVERDIRAQVVYGLTESPASLTYSRPDANLEQLTQTVGRPDPEIEFRLVNEEGATCAPGEPGEIQVRHDSSFAGYFDNPHATEDAFTTDRFLKTGDQAVERPDGYISIVGRLKEMYKSGGYNVYPREIEVALERHAAVATAVVVSVPDPLWSEVGCAFVVLHGDGDAHPDELREWCRGELANYKVPKHITVLPEFPLLPVGKPDKRRLTEWAEITQAEKSESV